MILLGQKASRQLTDLSGGSFLRLVCVRVVRHCQEGMQRNLLLMLSVLGLELGGEKLKKRVLRSGLPYTGSYLLITIDLLTDDLRPTLKF